MAIGRPWASLTGTANATTGRVAEDPGRQRCDRRAATARDVLERCDVIAAAPALGQFRIVAMDAVERYPHDDQAAIEKQADDPVPGQLIRQRAAIGDQLRRQTGRDHREAVEAQLELVRDIFGNVAHRSQVLPGLLLQEIAFDPSRQRQREQPEAAEHQQHHEHGKTHLQAGKQTRQH